MKGVGHIPSTECATQEAAEGILQLNQLSLVQRLHRLVASSCTSLRHESFAFNFVQALCVSIVFILSLPITVLNPTKSGDSLCYQPYPPINAQDKSEYIIDAHNISLFSKLLSLRASQRVVESMKRGLTILFVEGWSCAPSVEIDFAVRL